MGEVAGSAGAVLLLGLSSDVVADVIAPLVAAGFEVKLGSPAELPARPWSAVVSAPALPGVGSLELIAQLEALQPRPLLLVVTREGQSSPSGTEAIEWPFAPHELVSRVQMLQRLEPASPMEVLPPPHPTRVLDENTILERVMDQREEVRAGRLPGDSFLAVVRLDELEREAARLPPGARDTVLQQLAALAEVTGLADEQLGRAGAGELLVAMPGTSETEAAARLDALSSLVANHSFQLGGQTMHFSPIIGYTGLRRTANATDALRRAREAADRSALHLDLHPARWKPSAAKPVKEPGRLLIWWRRIYGTNMLIFQYLFTMAVGLGIPFFVYWWLGTHGFDISHAVYVFVVVALAATAISIWWEGLLALRRMDPPEEPATPYPPASAIIAAYLPNEAPIIEASVEAFLRVQYPGSLQVILAYNTPKDMPEIEERLREIARRNPRFIPMRVRTSTSKAQNVNAALPYATGAFTAVFDADHQPDPESFRRAWRWISHGADVVQGHCFIRNGAESWVAKMVAIEFEQIYAVSHPGRARLHGFGIFGGSNGYWRTELLRELRMHGFMLTEDIDSSMRAVVRGRQIVSDPYLVSRELAPETLQALTKQRLRWAQGWLQISMKWMKPALRAKTLTWRQKLGMVQLLAWREAYPWVSMQILPLIGWWAVQAGGLSHIDWFVPLFVVTTLFTLGTGPGQIWFTYKLADPQLKRHKSWFWFYLFTSTFFYSGLKNAWNRIAHYKEWRGETTWVVTPRVKAKK
jgi:cellulose synthase/poly-beta-1,6-N-acetylglucosamine synthase-like glycosyltransferase/GGDEF domain-containing protein